MATYNKQVFTGGKWLDKSKLKTGMRAKIMSETNPEASRYTDEKTGEFKMQDVCQVRVDGLSDVSKVTLNRITINALVEAFGNDSKSWMNHPLAINLSKRDGKAYLYFVPEGFTCTQDNEGYTVIIKNGDSLPVINEDDINAELAG